MAKNMIEALESLNRKLNRIKYSDEDKKLNLPSSDRQLQKKIILSEEEREEHIKRKYAQFCNPVSIEIESNEAALVEAFELFKSLEDLKKNNKSEKAFLKNYQIECSVCKSELDFIYYQCWFRFENGCMDFLPVIKKNPDKTNYLDFIHYDEINFFSAEKEIYGVISSLY